MLWPAQPLTVHWLNSRTNHVHHLHRNNGLLKALQLVSTLPNVGYLALLLVLENSIGVWVTGYNYLASSLDSPALLHTSHAAKFFWTSIQIYIDFKGFQNQCIYVLGGYQNGCWFANQELGQAWMPLYRTWRFPWWARWQEMGSRGEWPSNRVIKVHLHIWKTKKINNYVCL